MNFHITLSMAVSMLTNIVHDFGEDHKAAGGGEGTFSGCVYMTANETTGEVTPVCIVGQAFHRWGILRALTIVNDPDTDSLLVGTGLFGPEGYGAVCNMAAFNSSAVRLLKKNGITLDDKAVVFLKKAQSEQDQGRTWGSALRTALAGLY